MQNKKVLKRHVKLYIITSVAEKLLPMSTILRILDLKSYCHYLEKLYLSENIHFMSFTKCFDVQ